MVKSILFITPDTFGYYKSIKSSMEKIGYEVDWHNHIPNSNSYIKASSRIMPSLISIYSDYYFNNNISWDKNYDFILIIKGESVSNKIIQKMKACFLDSTFIYYNWDSFSNIKNGLEKKSFFDRVLSFDIEDCKRHSDVEHLPLFYTAEYCNYNKNIDESYKYISFFVGTIHSDRYDLIEKLSKVLEKRTGMEAVRYYFYANKLIFNILKFFDEAFKPVPFSQVNFTALKPFEIANYLNNSKIVIDVCHSKQTGLTMRTIECLGMKKKLITNNKSILEYDFYHKNNILLIDDKLNVPEEFLSLPYHELPNTLYEKYSIEKWVKTLLGN